MLSLQYLIVTIYFCVLIIFIKICVCIDITRKFVIIFSSLYIFLLLRYINLQFF